MRWKLVNPKEMVTMVILMYLVVRTDFIFWGRFICSVTRVLGYLHWSRISQVQFGFAACDWRSQKGLTPLVVRGVFTNGTVSQFQFVNFRHRCSRVLKPRFGANARQRGFAYFLLEVSASPKFKSSQLIRTIRRMI